MGRNYKERAAYAYQHGTGRAIPQKLLYRIKRKWWRRNNDIGEMRAKRKNQAIFQMNILNDNYKKRY